jgi:hypothetical protein
MAHAAKQEFCHTASAPAADHDHISANVVSDIGNH